MQGRTEAPEFVQLLDFEEQEEKEINNVVDLKLVGGSNTPPGEDWLVNLEVGTVFLARDKKNLSNYNLGLFRLMEKTQKAVVLKTPALPTNLYILSNLFCRDYSLHEVIGVLEVPQEQEETMETIHERNRDEGDSHPEVQ